MAQKLALPLNNCTITAMYKDDSNPAYQHDWDAGGHFGLDMYGSPATFYASGNGTVVGVGGSASVGVGYWVAIKYTNVYRWSMNSSSLTTLPAVIVRYFHLASKSSLKVGDSVTLDTVIGRMGNTGAWNMGTHLHVEADTDINYPLYTPTLTGAAGGLYAGVRGSGDTTIDPCTIFFRKTSAPENQTVGYSQSYCNTHGTSEPYINTAKVNALNNKTFS